MSALGPRGDGLPVSVAPRCSEFLVFLKAALLSAPSVCHSWTHASHGHAPLLEGRPSPQKPVRGPVGRGAPQLPGNPSKVWGQACHVSSLLWLGELPVPFFLNKGLS